MTKSASIKAKIASTVAAMASLPFVASAATALQTIKEQANTTATAAGVTSDQGNDLAGVIGRLINSALGLLGIILVVIIIYAGFLWMTAQGDDKKVGEAKLMIKQAIVGIIIIFSAYALTDFVLTNVLESAF